MADYFDYIKVGPSQGWQCPVCGAVNAPWLSQCPCNGKVPTHTTTTGTDYITYPYPYKDTVIKKK